MSAALARQQHSQITHHPLETLLISHLAIRPCAPSPQEAARKLGLERRVYTAGEAKVQLDPFLPVQPEQVSVPESSAGAC